MDHCEDSRKQIPCQLTPENYMQITHLCEEDFRQIQYIPIALILVLNIWTLLIGFSSYFETANFSINESTKKHFFLGFTVFITICKDPGLVLTARLLMLRHQLCEDHGPSSRHLHLHHQEEKSA